MVLTDALGVDAEATRGARAGRVRARVRPNAGTDFDFGPERVAWERVFDDPTMLALNRGLFALPKAVRQKVRRRIVEEAVPGLPRAGYGRLDEALADADAVRARLEAAMRRAFAEHGVEGYEEGRAAEPRVESGFRPFPGRGPGAARESLDRRREEAGG